MATGQKHLSRRAKHSSIKDRGDKDLPRPFVNISKDKNQYQLNPRTRHSSIVIKDSLYCWGGDEHDLSRPFVTDSKDMRKRASTVYIFYLSTFDSERALITGNPPEGVMGYACTSIENNLLYFGGSCKSLDCYHNNLHKLNSLTNPVCLNKY